MDEAWRLADARLDGLREDAIADLVECGDPSFDQTEALLEQWASWTLLEEVDLALTDECGPEYVAWWQAQTAEGGAPPAAEEAPPSEAGDAEGDVIDAEYTEEKGDSAS